MTDKDLIHLAACAAAFYVGLLVGQGRLRLPGVTRPAPAAPLDPMSWLTEYGKGGMP